MVQSFGTLAQKGSLIRALIAPHSIFLFFTSCTSCNSFNFQVYVTNILCVLRDTTQDLYTVMGALYSACMFLGVSNSSSVQPVVSIERTVFYRERAAGMYSAYPYAFAQVSLASFYQQAREMEKIPRILMHRYFFEFNRAWWRSHILWRRP